MGAELRVLNLAAARFDCTFGRGCEGTCCRNGRPPAYPRDVSRIRENFDKFLPLVRPEVLPVLLRDGFLTRRKKAGVFTLRVVHGWCVFFHRGCVLEQAGREEGNRLLYKPVECAVFPLEKNGRGEWFVRQKGFAKEEWDLPCLDPALSNCAAGDSLQEELALAAAWEADAEGMLGFPS